MFRGSLSCDIDTPRGSAVNATILMLGRRITTETEASE